MYLALIPAAQTLAALRAFAPVLTDDAHCTKHFCIEDFEPRIELP